MERSEADLTKPSAGSVLVIDPDADIGQLLLAILTDEGYTVSLLHDTAPQAVQVAVGRLEPDCVLLDGTGPLDYGASWEQARLLAIRGRQVPVIMFTDNQKALTEARAEETTRSQEAQFSSIVAKPFDLEELLEAVAKATGASLPFDRSAQADAVRTQALVEQLRAGGARDIRRSTRREWATYLTPQEHFGLLYWWQSAGGYYVAVFPDDGSVLQPLGFFTDRDAAIACALLA